MILLLKLLILLLVVVLLIALSLKVFTDHSAYQWLDVKFLGRDWTVDLAADFRSWHIGVTHQPSSPSLWLAQIGPLSLTAHTFDQK